MLDITNIPYGKNDTCEYIEQDKSITIEEIQIALGLSSLILFWGDKNNNG